MRKRTLTRGASLIAYMHKSNAAIQAAKREPDAQDEVREMQAAEIEARMTRRNTECKRFNFRW